MSDELNSLHTKNKKLNVYSILITIFVILFLNNPIYAVAKIKVDGYSYESSDNPQYELMDKYLVKQMGFGRASIGQVNVKYGGGIEKGPSKNIQSYKAKGPIKIEYDFEGNFKSNRKDVWQITSDSGKKAAGIQLSGKVRDGALIIRRKIGTSSWQTVEEYTNFFGNKKIDRKNLHEIPEEDLKRGVYYQIIVAYKIEKKVGEKSGFLGIKTDVMVQRYCIEEYQFFAYYDGNPVKFKELTTNRTINSQNKVSSGFIVDKNGSTFSVEIIKDNGNPMNASSLQRFTDPGKYEISVIDPLGKAYPFEITVTNGTKMSDTLTGKVFRNNKKTGYQDRFIDDLNSVTNIGPRVFLSLGQSPASAKFTKGAYDNVQAFGINSQNVQLYLHFNDKLPEGWEIVSDNYGNKDSEKIMDVKTGQIKTGALIIKTSKDNKNYKGINANMYSNGLLTTNFEYYYHDKGDILVYTPNGKDVQDGIYIQVYYAYEIKNTSKKIDLRCLERYWFYLCSDNMGAVTFHNLSAGEKLNQTLGGYDEATTEISKHTETMLSEAYTVSGFVIDTTLNPVVTYTITRDGERISNSSKAFKETGKYIVSLKNPVKTEREVVLYVDRMSDEEAFEFYFGKSFIRGKRIYSEGQYPVYEGGHTSYYLNEVDRFHVPLGGYIKNITTDETIEITPDRKGIKGDLITPGEYIAVFNTNPKFHEDPASGDCREFTFHFHIIANGTAPGPVVNKRNLTEKYAHTTITDSYPIYYGLIYQSAAKGNITLAFATKEAAVEYAKSYERGMVEPQNDGSYRYNGSFIVSQKETYESNWDLMDAIEYFASEAVHERYFDFSEEFTILSLSEDIIENTENIRTLELDRSVVLFADGQKPMLTNIKALPIVSPKPYQYLAPGLDGKIDKGFVDFEFIRDKYGCDSNTVVIIDSNGKEYPIQYNKGVGKQLSSSGCSSGVVTIRESTIYGDTTDYSAIYIADGENTSTLTLSTYVDGEEKQQVFSQTDNNREITVNAFAVSEIHDILDPYNLIVIQNNQDINQNNFFTADKINRSFFYDTGSFRISVVNRLGFGYTINVNVEASDDVIIKFSGVGTEGFEDLHVEFGETNVKLPYPTRYGYDFMGYEDKNGNIYNDEIAEILFRGSSLLNAVWKAKEFNLTLQGSDGKVIGTTLVKFGEPVQLPDPISSDEDKIANWIFNGKVLEENTFTLSVESNVTLVSTEKASNFAQQTETDSSLNAVTLPSDKTDVIEIQSQSTKNIIMIGIGGVICVAFVLIALLTRNKKQTDKDNKIEKEQKVRIKSGKKK